MLIFDHRVIGNRLLALRKKDGRTQAELAEAAGLSDRTYADIERGTVNMRTETLLRICDTLKITPDEILTEDRERLLMEQSELFEKLNELPKKERETALRLLSVYIESL